MFTEKQADPNESLLTFMTQAQGFSMSKFTKE
jgi:hypothetical protein